MANRDFKAYISWRRMRTRCANGYMKELDLTFDSRWNSFPNFLEDMGERPDGMTLERKNNSEGYSKENCKWATAQEQALNRHNKSVLGPYIYVDHGTFRFSKDKHTKNFKTAEEARNYRDKVLRIETEVT
jgi:hypothetical protein